MWSVVKIGSKQYKVTEGDIIQVQRLQSASGSKVVFDKVMLLSRDGKLDVGKPYLGNVKIEAEVLGEKKSDKTIIFKYKRRKAYQRKRGHRQILTSLKILKIKSK